jgi:beta-ureidopropionase
MPRIVKCGLIQAKNAAPTDLPIEEIKRIDIERHLSLIESAAREGAKIICMQEVFTTPYFCAEQQTRWYEAVERIPDGPTVKLMQEVAREHGVVLVVPIYEEEITGVYYNTAAVIDADGKYLGKYRKLLGEVLFQAGQSGLSVF